MLYTVYENTDKILKINLQCFDRFVFKHIIMILWKIEKVY
jgi:hypothetical protein